jgi:hypothetical protein
MSLNATEPDTQMNRGAGRLASLAIAEGTPNDWIAQQIAQANPSASIHVRGTRILIRAPRLVVRQLVQSAAAQCEYSLDDETWRSFAAELDGRMIWQDEEFTVESE